ncbi:uncharacterized protein LOC131653031 [Vicia villosa]|uniref:uncharacterized protein LOC131653031 n=1 Tax=Vicia villosa TaxID=3911 RepID=UPI00273C5BC8|nr:uncharacterized protein LOC131653031 [Vicia villosa]XP_058779043.1 uncharacterized protein LOC131653031 [Vicia villosa]XP_058779044.1 uncharacterized protein LOC131653031 [Vicia villosa]XP_058779045.1 uncharacterized protein LOC131653031 [Vicia villosa]XP_058779046.1 uncharacterized protein LOC131653031 [Vicia villosa]XP_058779047.1 uncharacterized protein LOC131653031 [Vicia villosa]XP_058779048.1 uncharacterized protein LOC131653031 [Vicia villosa]XP_058779049.1 uncharacterized protein 
MNGNSQNNYRGVWNNNNMPSTAFSPGLIPHSSGPHAFADNPHIPHQVPTYYADNQQIPHQMPTYYADNRQIPHQAPTHYVDTRNLPHQTPTYHVGNMHLSQHPTPTHYADNRPLLPTPMPTHYANIRHLQHQMPAHYTDNRYLPHPMPVHYADNRHLLHPTPAYYADNRHLLRPTQLPHQTAKHCTDSKHLPHQTVVHSTDNKHLSHQTVVHSTDNKHLPHQTAVQYEDKMCLPHQMTKELADKMHLPNPNPEDYAANKCLPHKTPDHNADKRQLPQQTSEAYADKSTLPQKTSEAYADKRQLPQQPSEHSADMNLSQQTPKDSADKKCLPHKTPDHKADKRQLPQQTSEAYADKRQLPHQTSEHSADKNLSQQTPKDSADKKCLPQQTPEDCANKKCLPPLLQCEICDLKLNPKCMEFHKKGGRHRRRLLELQEQSTKHKTSSGKEIRPNQSSQTSNKRLPPVVRCEICDIQICFPNSLKTHNRRRKHKRLLSLREKSMKHKDSNGEEISHIRSSQINPVVQPKKVPTDVSKRKLSDHTGAKDHGFKVENVKNETSSFKKKNVPAEMSKRKVTDNTDAKDHGFKHDIEGATGGKYMKMNNGIRRSVKNDQPQSTPVELKASAGSNIIAEKEYISCDFAATVILIPQGPVASHAFTPPPPTKESSFEPKNHIDLTEAEEHHKVQKCGVETNDEPQSISMKLQGLGGCNISSVAEDNSSDSDVIVIALPQGHVTSQVLTPSPAAGSSFEHPIQIDSQIEVEEGPEFHEVQNHSVETNDQPHSISTEFHAIAGSDINTSTEGTCSDSGAILIASPPSNIAYEVSTPVAVIQTGMSDSNNEIQNPIVDSNNQHRSISMELHGIAGSMTNNQTEVVNSDSTAREIYKEPLASLLPDAVGLSFEPVTEHGLDTETEPNVSEAILYSESQHPAEETDIELLPPVLMEIDVPLEVGAETKTEDGNSQAKMKMDVDLSPESGKTKLLKVSVCLTCGDEGFEEAIVYCSKCGDYAMHRYCLVGPVVFTDKVTWFCMDCEEVVVEADHPNSETPESEKDEVVFDPQPIADPIWRGSLQVFNKSFDKIRGLMGHLSTLACPKVLEEASHLPDVLYANLLQRSAVWPESFKKFGTNNQSIGLYFFPENESVRSYYDQLVDEMISNDLAIRVMVEKTELLIFSSTLLPRQYKRFHSKYYLWGTFKRKQVTSTMKDT